MATMIMPVIVLITMVMAMITAAGCRTNMTVTEPTVLAMMTTMIMPMIVLTTMVMAMMAAVMVAVMMMMISMPLKQMMST